MLNPLTRYLPYAVPAVSCDTVAEPFFAVAHSNDALRVSIPGQVIDSTGNDVIFSFGGTFACTIPNPYGARNISTSDIETGGRKAGNGRLCGMLSVLLADGRVVDGS